MTNVFLIFITVLLVALAAIVVFLSTKLLKKKDNTEDINSIKNELTELRNSSNNQFTNLSNSFSGLSKDITKDLNVSLTRVQEDVKRFNEKADIMNKTQENLTKVFSNVKKFGTAAEYSLASLLKDLLSPTQYIANAKIKEDKQETVEFAIKLPKNVLISIDSFFPATLLENIREADDKNDKKLSQEARYDLAQAIKAKAETISKKYINPPRTVPYGVMYLSTESLFFEVSAYRYPKTKELLIQKIKREYNINILGPTTISVFLQSLQMGFETLQIHQRSRKIYEDLQSLSFKFSQHFKMIEEVYSTMDKAMKKTADFGKSARQISKILDDIKEPETQTAIDINPEKNPNNLKVLK
tara:strand:- start:2453 stop:3520 length:1068 start_codon:yes stop_codon:yes gene_type:complete